ncbi:hypothetical protein MB828_23975 [Streptomyces arenae]|nr:hypothetical protein [Streptomyces arenae]MCG7206834.1 hypothetical protein [Streptomyces arenae]
MSLNNLSNQQSNTGKHQAALTSITEAVTIRRALVEGPNGAAFLPNLASSLNNLSVQQSDTGNHQAALTSITEAVTHYRTLTQGPNGPASLPNLASCLNNLSVQQSNTGNHQAALTSITEAVTHYRTLVQGPNGPAFLPDLASCLNNLSVQQSDTGDHQAALTSITEAVTYYRSLVQGPNGPAFLPDLASCLNNLSNQQSDTGDRQAALTSITEAVTHYRTLVQGPNGPAFLANLAGSLNNLSNQQSDTGDHQAALTSITEAVTHYRTLAQGPNGPASLPDLAMSLNNLSNQQSNTGDHQAALTSITEAVTHYRTLAQGPNGPASLPNLAMSLNNLSNQQSNTGDHQAALTSITEAVTHYRTLAQGPNGPAFLPDLASSLNNLYNQQCDTGGQEGSLLTSDEVISGFAAGPQAELLISRAHWHMTRGNPMGATTDLISAIHQANETTDPTWIGRVRRAVRGLVDDLQRNPAAQTLLSEVTTRLPTWAVGALSDQSVELFNRWLSTRSWPEREDFLRQEYPHLITADEQTALDIARALYPEAAALSELSTLLTVASEHGLDQVLDEGRSFHTAADLLRQWIAAPSWPEDLEFLRDHPQLTSDPIVPSLLSANAQSPTARQHLGILLLTQLLSIPDIYDAVVDSTTAVDTAMRFVEKGQPEGLHPLLLAAPGLARMPFVTPYLVAVQHLFATTDDEEQENSPSLSELIALAAEQGSEVQRGAGAGRLRSLARHRPEHAATLLQLADALAAPVQANSAEAPTDAG